MITSQEDLRRQLSAKNCQDIPQAIEESIGQERRQTLTWQLHNFILTDRNFQEPLGKPEKKRAALAHFDTIFSLDKIMVQLTIQAVLVSRRIIYS